MITDASHTDETVLAQKYYVNDILRIIHMKSSSIYDGAMSIGVFAMLLALLLLLAGCSSDLQQPKAVLDSNRNLLTIDEVRYLRDKELIDIGQGSNQWKYELKAPVQIASAKDKSGQKEYLIFANGTEQRFLYGYEDTFYFSSLPYEVWIREDMLGELSKSAAVGKFTCEGLSHDQLARLLALYRSTEPADSLIFEDARAEAQMLGIEDCQLRHRLDLFHQEIQGLAFCLNIHFSARTGRPYIQCLDGKLRPCPEDVMDALGISPSLPQIYPVTEDDPWLSMLQKELYLESKTDSVSLDKLKSDLGEDQALQELEFRIDVYSRGNDRWPLYWLKGFYHLKTEELYLLFQDEILYRIPQK